MAMVKMNLKKNPLKFFIILLEMKYLFSLHPISV